MVGASERIKSATGIDAGKKSRADLHANCPPKDGYRIAAHMCLITRAVFERKSLAIKHTFLGFESGEVGKRISSAIGKARKAIASAGNGAPFATAS